jgi:hypothetical protein
MCYCICEFYVRCFACLETRCKKLQGGGNTATQYSYNIKIQTFAAWASVVAVVVFGVFIALGIRTHLQVLLDNTERGGCVLPLVSLLPPPAQAPRMATVGSAQAACGHAFHASLCVARVCGGCCGGSGGPWSGTGCACGTATWFSTWAR